MAARLKSATSCAPFRSPVWVTRLGKKTEPQNIWQKNNGLAGYFKRLDRYLDHFEQPRPAGLVTDSCGLLPKVSHHHF